MLVQPVTLAGQYVRLEPLSMAHYDQLVAVGLDEDIWRWTLYVVRTPDEMRAFIDSELKRQVDGANLVFAQIDIASGRAIGTTRLMNIDTLHRRVEIGGTWIARSFQRTPLNTEAKYLLLRHAFETWDCIRVEFKTDALNEPSRRAILRLGAKEEGRLRKHMITASGRIRDSLYFSITDDEWLDVKAQLEAKLARPYPQQPD